MRILGRSLLESWGTFRRDMRAVAENLAGSLHLSGLYLLRATRSRVVVTYGGLGRSPGCDGFRVDFGSVKEIVSGARLSSRPG
jgi:hypothetical protein